MAEVRVTADFVIPVTAAAAEGCAGGHDVVHQHRPRGTAANSRNRGCRGSPPIALPAGEPRRGSAAPARPAARSPRRGNAISSAGSTPYLQRRRSTRGMGTRAAVEVGRRGASTRPMPTSGIAWYFRRCTNFLAGSSCRNAERTSTPPIQRSGSRAQRIPASSAQHRVTGRSAGEARHRDKVWGRRFLAYSLHRIRHPETLELAGKWGHCGRRQPETGRPP